MKNKFKIFFSFVLCLISSIYSTPLDDYVNSKDDHYKYEILKAVQFSEYKLFYINMTSQKWQDENVVDKPVWWHWMMVSVPNKILRPNASFIYIGDDDNTQDFPDPDNTQIRLTSVYAVQTGTIATLLRNIPNQPLVFKDDGEKKHRREDEIIGWTWHKFLQNTSNPSILAHLPMTKAVIRAMDTIEDFVLKNSLAKIKKFMLAGESKRGWITWLSAAVDPKRVYSAVPVVLDFLDINKNLHSHFKCLGGWTFAFYPYYVLNITKYADSRELFEFQKITDPINYLDRYKDTSILVMTTSGDEFFLPEDTHSYWQNLFEATDGKVLLRRLPNAEHLMIAHAISEFESITAFFFSTYERIFIPKLRWTLPNNATHGIIRATVDTTNSPKPSSFQAFYAKTLDNKRRDFRLASADPKDPSKPVPHPVVWFSTQKEVQVDEKENSISYEISFPKPTDGWLGFFLEFSFRNLDNSVNIVTTETNVIPEFFPFEDCFGNECFGSLV